MSKYDDLERLADETQAAFLAADKALQADRQNDALRADWLAKMDIADAAERERQREFDRTFGSDRGRAILHDCGVTDERIDQFLARRAASRGDRFSKGSSEANQAR